MKTIYKLLCCTSLLVFFACGGMTDSYQEFIGDGEFVYLPKVRSVKAIAGKNRVLIEAVFFNSPTAKNMEIYWNDENNRPDSLVVPVSLSAGMDTVLVSVPDLAEKAFTFTVYIRDSYGSRSLPETVAAEAFGELFQKSLSNLSVTRAALTEEGGLVSWGRKTSKLAKVEILYQNKNGQQTLQTVDGIPETGYSIPNTLLEDVISGSRFSYRSLYVPQYGSPDTFYTIWGEYSKEFPSMLFLDKKTLKMIDCSSETASDGGGYTTIIDDNLNTYWQSSYTGGAAPFPHWVRLDMLKSRDIAKIDLWRRTTFPDTKDVVIKINENLLPYNDPSWKEMGTLSYPTANGDDMRTLEVMPEEVASGRYLLLYLDNSYRSTFVSIAEMDIYVR